MRSNALVFALIALSCALHVNAHPDGADPLACSNGQTPGHGVDIQTSPAPYTLTVQGGASSYTPGSAMTVTLAGASTTFRGFLLSAMLLGDTSDAPTRLGSFVGANGANAQSICASGGANGITHTENSDKSSIAFTFTPPAAGTGSIRLQITVVQTHDFIWKFSLPLTEASAAGGSSAAASSSSSSTAAAAGGSSSTGGNGGNSGGTGAVGAASSLTASFGFIASMVATIMTYRYFN